MKKRIFAALGALLLLLMLTACAGQTAVNAAQSLPAEMTEEENAVLALLGGSQTSVFDFTTDNALRSVRVERYELQNGAWKAFGGGSFAVSGEKGRIALTMNPNSGEIRFAVQDDQRHQAGLSGGRPDRPCRGDIGAFRAHGDCDRSGDPADDPDSRFG